MADDLPEHIKKYEKLKKHVPELMRSTQRSHMEAYYKAVDAILKEEGQEHPDYDKLKKGDVQQAFADKMADYYVEQARKVFRVKADKDDDKLGELEKNLLLKSYIGATRSTLRDIVGKYGNKYEIGVHTGATNELLKKINEELTAATTYHFKKEHIDDLLKGSGADKLIDKDYLELEDAIAIYEIFKENGAITRKMLEDAGFKTPKLKKEKK